VKLTPKLEKTIAPLFKSLNRRMLTRFKGYSDGDVALIRDFLTETADEMRSEAGRLPKGSGE